MLRTVHDPASRIHHHALLEDEESIQASLMEVVNALLRGTIELKRAELILRALNTAVRNIRRVHFGLHSDDMVREIPDYPDPPLEQVDEEAAAAFAARHQARRSRARRLPGRPTCGPRECSCCECRDSRPQGFVWGRVSDPSRRPRSTGPQCSATEAGCNRSRNPQAASKCERAIPRKHKDRSRGS